MAQLFIPNGSVKTAQRSNGIDALRGVAALIIVIYHVRPMFWGGLRQIWETYGLSFHPNAVLGYLSAPFSFGGLAVDLFFVLSGYCIHRKAAKLLAQNPNFKLDLKRYFARRILRIYPVYSAALVLTALAHSYVASRAPSLVANQDNSWFAFVINLLSLQGILAPNFAHNSVFWTLAIEIHFYLIYPFVFYLLSKWNCRFIFPLMFLISFTYITVDSLFNLSELFPYRGSGGPLFVPYLFVWGVGIYLAELEADRTCLPRKTGRQEIIFLGGVIFLITFSWGVLGVAFVKDWMISVLVVLACGYLVYWSKSPRGEIFWRKTLGRSLAGLGLFSYSLYAIHRPCLLILKYWIDPSDQKYLSLLPSFLVTMLCIVFAYVFFRLVEHWTLKSPKTLVKPFCERN